MNAPHPPPAGWYPDPSGRAPFRYWDGQQWTEHTNQGTAPNPSVAQPVATAPAYLGTPTAVVAAPGGPLTAQAFTEDLKRLEGYALVVVGFVIFLVFSFFTWSSAEKTYLQTGASGEGSSNAWDGDGTWLIRGWEVDLDSLNKIEMGQGVDGGTDMVILLPIALVGVGLALATRMGKPVQFAKEGALGASALLAVLMIAEIIHVNGAIDDAKDIYGQNAIQLDGSVGFGMYISALGAVAMAVGAARTFMASRKSA